MTAVSVEMITPVLCNRTKTEVELDPLDASIS